MGFPSVVLNFDEGATGTEYGFTCVRGDSTTCASYVDASGLIRLAAANKLRRTYAPDTKESLGLLLEPSSTNLVLNNTIIGSTSWTLTGATATQSAALSPDNTLTASKLIVDTAVSTVAADAAGSVVQAVTVSASAAFTFSMFAKTAELSAIRLRENVTGCRVNVNLSTGAVVYEVGTSSDIAVTTTKWSNGWWRIVGTRTTGVAETTATIQIKPGIDTGNGSSGVYVWGAQLEQKNCETSFIYTTGSTVTRAADNFYTTNLTSFGFNTSVGTLFVKHRLTGDGNYNDLCSFGKSAAGVDYIGFVVYPGYYRMAEVGNAVNQAAVNTGQITKYVTTRSAMAWQLNNTQGASNGTTSPLDSACTIPTGMTKFSFGGDARFGGSGTIAFPVTVASMAYWPERLPTAELLDMSINGLPRRGGARAKATYFQDDEEMFDSSL